jgi:hypothetical protein
MSSLIFVGSFFFYLPDPNQPLELLENFIHKNVYLEQFKFSTGKVQQTELTF